MRTSSTIAILLAAGLGSGLVTARAFEVTRGSAPSTGLGLDAPRAAPVPPAPMLTLDATREAMPPPPSIGIVRPRQPAQQVVGEGSGCGVFNARVADRPKVLSSLQYAAEQGHPAAQWQLGSMFARGEGVPRDDLKAFDYFSRIADDHADEMPGSPQARIAANAFVALGCYYLEGIPNSKIQADPEEARNRFFYAASYFGDPDAQYHLARTMLDGVGGPRIPQQAIKWLGLSAAKGHYQAQAVLGRLLFEGSLVRRQAARGLMWLSIARDSASPDEAWIVESWDSAFKQASDDERSMALKYIEERLQAGRR